MSIQSLRTTLGLMLVAILVTASCGGSVDRRPDRAVTTAGPVSPVAKRCGGPAGNSAKAFELRARGGDVMPAVEIGRGSTVAVFLHQTGAFGLCGWWPYANWLTQTAGIRAVLFDLCGYGESQCSAGKFADDQVGQVRLATDWARSHGATRVVLVGASMGGSVAAGAARPARADAVVDLSGPALWPDLDASKTFTSLRMPTLVAISEQTDPDDHALLKKLFSRIPATRKEFIDVPSGHGWDMLDGETGTWSPLARTVRSWIVGRS